MNKSIASSTFPVTISTPSVWMRTGGIVLTGSAFVAVCAHIALPLFFTPVPLSMAPFAVLLLGLALSPRLAAATLAAYLVEGALGLPVFAPGPLAGPEPGREPGAPGRGRSKMGRPRCTPGAGEPGGAV